MSTNMILRSNNVTINVPPKKQFLHAPMYETPLECSYLFFDRGKDGRGGLCLRAVPIGGV